MKSQKAAASVSKKTVASGKPVAHGVGRRKKSVARVWLRRGGTGTLLVNGKPHTIYFDTDVARLQAYQSMATIPASVNYDVEVNVEGGGLKGQAGAVKLAIARALLETDETLRPVLRTSGLLTVDGRRKERKKYGRRGARRGFQFVKR
ncbi:MAG: 30S ribosomal protein S9 [Candidatus Babeliales bacterium]